MNKLVCVTTSAVKSEDSTKYALDYPLKSYNRLNWVRLELINAVAKRVLQSFQQRHQVHVSVFDLFGPTKSMHPSWFRDSAHPFSQDKKTPEPKLTKLWSREDTWSPEIDMNAMGNTATRMLVNLLLNRNCPPST